MKVEVDPDFEAFAALRQADRLEAADHPEQAALLLSSIPTSDNLSPQIREKVEHRLAALEGRGNFGSTFESMLSRFSREAQRPWPMLAMAGASAVFQISRFALLANLRGPLTSLARPLAIIGEAGAFTAALPALEKISPHPVGASWRGFGTEFLSSLLLMGSMRAAAWPLRFLSANSSHFPALFGGVLFAQAVEQKLGWLSSNNAETSLLQGLALTLQLYAGMGIMRGALSSAALRSFAEAEGRLRNAAPSSPMPALPDGTYAMSGIGSNGSARPPLRLVSADPHEEFVQTFSRNRAFQDAYHSILSHYGSRHDGARLSSLLLLSGVQHPQVMNPGLERLAGILRGNPGEASVTYRDWLAHRIYERVYFEKRTPLALGELLRSLSLGENSTAMERRLAPHFSELDLRNPIPFESPERSMQFQIEAAKRLYDWRQFERQSRGLPLDDSSRRVVWDWKQTLQAKPLGNFNAEVDKFLDRFYNLGEGPLASRVPEVNAAIAAAGQSPLGVARLARLDALFRASHGEPATERLLELH
jgi:hypothetical protein